MAGGPARSSTHPGACNPALSSAHVPPQPPHCPSQPADQFVPSFSPAGALTRPPSKFAHVPPQVAGPAHPYLHTRTHARPHARTPPRTRTFLACHSICTSCCSTGGPSSCAPCSSSSSVASMWPDWMARASGDRSGASGLLTEALFSSRSCRGWGWGGRQGGRLAGKAVLWRGREWGSSAHENCVRDEWQEGRNSKTVAAAGEQEMRSHGMHVKAIGI